MGGLNNISIEDFKSLCLISEYDGSVCSFVGYGERSRSLIKVLYQYPKKKYPDVEYVYDTLECIHEDLVCLPMDENISSLDKYKKPMIWYQFVIWYLEEESIDNVLVKWKLENRINIIVAILPKQNDTQKNREIAIENLRKLYEAGKCIYLIDEEKVDGEETICREICRLANSLLAVFCEEIVTALDYSDCAWLLEDGFIYYAQGEDYKLEKAFDVQQLVRTSGVSDKVPVNVDRILFLILFSYENELQIEQMGHLHEQFKLINSQQEMNWGFGYKREDENDNFHSYAFFIQKKFPDYLKKE